MQNGLQEPTPLLTKMTDMEIIMEDSLDGGPPSVGSGDIIPAAVSTPCNSGTATPVSTKKVSDLGGHEHDVWNISFLQKPFAFCFSFRSRNEMHLKNIP